MGNRPVPSLCRFTIELRNRQGELRTAPRAGDVLGDFGDGGPRRDSIPRPKDGAEGRR